MGVPQVRKKSFKDGNLRSKLTIRFREDKPRVWISGRGEKWERLMAEAKEEFDRSMENAAGNFANRAKKHRRANAEAAKKKNKTSPQNPRVEKVTQRS